MLDVQYVVELLDSIHNLLVEAWAIDTHGHVIGTAICDGLRTSGGLDLIFDNCISTDERLVHHSMKLLEQALTVDNRSYLACQGSGRGLQKVLKAVAKGCYCTPHQDISTFYDCEENCEYQTHDPELDVESSRVRTGILEHMFKDSEATCLEVVKMGGLKVIVSECRKRDVETLRHCASALANLSLYGGSENHQVRTVWITIAKQKFSWSRFCQKDPHAFSRSWEEGVIWMQNRILKTFCITTFYHICRSHIFCIKCKNCLATLKLHFEYYCRLWSSTMPNHGCCPWLSTLTQTWNVILT